MGGDEALACGGAVRVPGETYDAGGLISKIAKLSKADRAIVEALVESLLKREKKK